MSTTAKRCPQNVHKKSTKQLLRSTTWTRGTYCTCSIIDMNEYNLPVYMSTIAKQLLHEVHKKSTKSPQKSPQKVNGSNININGYNLPVYMSTTAKHLVHNVHKMSTNVHISPQSPHKSTKSTFNDGIVDFVDFSTIFLSPQFFDK